MIIFKIVPFLLILLYIPTYLHAAVLNIKFGRFKIDIHPHVSLHRLSFTPARYLGRIHTQPGRCRSVGENKLIPRERKQLHLPDQQVNYIVTVVYILLNCMSKSL